MAGRGTDIVLGMGLAELGGLHIIGTERHESRRIDNQLRGRCARQGDPGSTRFYLSLEDDLMRLFGSDNISGIMDKLGMEEDEPIEHKIVTRSIESAQKKVEARNFEIRKQVLEYDDVMNQQREVIYDSAARSLKKQTSRRPSLTWQAILLTAPWICMHQKRLTAKIGMSRAHQLCRGVLCAGRFPEGRKTAGNERDELETFLHKVAVDYYNAREENNTAPIMRELENLVMLKVVDSHWMEHLDAMDALREGIGLRAYGQRDPLVEYKFEAYEMFEAMKEAIVDDVVRYMYRVNVVTQPVVEDHLSEASTNNPNVDGSTETPKEPVRNDSTVGRNDPCPCGSGKKYKNCCGKNQNS